MYTPPGPAENWALLDSVEDEFQEDEYGIMSSVADDENWQFSQVPTPARFTASEGPSRATRSVSITSHTQQANELAFLPWTDWNGDTVYDEVPQKWIRYFVETKVFVDKKQIFRCTDQNVVLDPVAFGPLVLLPRLDQALLTKIPPPRTTEPSHSEVTVSVTERNEYDFVQEYQGTNVGWQAMLKQILAWKKSVKKGKKIKVNLIFRRRETSESTAADNQGSATKSTRKTISTQMHADRANQLNAEAATSDEPAVWQDVFAKFHCPGPPCKFRPWCWYDSITKMRYELKIYHLKILIRHRQQGNPLDSHDQVPDALREMVYREHRQNSSKKQSEPSTNVPPIQITNVLPDQSSVEERADVKRKARSITIPRLRDVNVQKYGDWQMAQIEDKAWQAEFQKATDFVRANFIDLELLFVEQNDRVLVEDGHVNAYVAKQYIRDIEVYAAKRCRNSPSLDDTTSF